MSLPPPAAPSTDVSVAASGAAPDSSANVRRLAALAYFAFPLAAIWGPGLIFGTAKNEYTKRHAGFALAVQATFLVVWIPANALVMFGVLDDLTAIAVAIAVPVTLMCWGLGVAAWRGWSAPRLLGR